MPNQTSVNGVRSNRGIASDGRSGGGQSAGAPRARGGKGKTNENIFCFSIQALFREAITRGQSTALLSSMRLRSGLENTAGDALPE